MCTRALAPLVAMLLSTTALADGGAGNAGDLSVAAATITYHVVHKLHRVDGVSHQVDARARLDDGGRALFEARVPVASFDSGNVNRDAHMKEVIEAARFPLVELKALAADLTQPTSYPVTIEVPFAAQLTLHGVHKMLTLPVTLTFEAARRIRAHASFTVSLDEFKVQRPSLMFVKVDDAMKIEADLLLRQ